MYGGLTDFWIWGGVNHTLRVTETVAADSAEVQTPALSPMTGKG